ncbi:MAG: hypothetical protein GY808_05335, partial [Gammaproteobacteria bacterium]|nr:hypothetical protein [Gammaproteobacteria bacterium]
TTMLDDIRFIGAGGDLAPIANAGSSIIKIDNDNNGTEKILLDATGSIDFDGTISSYSWVSEETEISTEPTVSFDFEIGTHRITLIVTDNDGYSDEDQIDIMIKAQIDDCDSKDGWGSANTLEVNTVNQKQGIGCLESTGSNSAEFTKVFSVPISADSSTSIGFWYYVSDINMLRSTNQVEFGSGGKADVNEYNWPLENLKTGWNYIILYFENATVSGGDPNLDAINWFRLY